MIARTGEQDYIKHALEGRIEIARTGGQDYKKHAFESRIICIKRTMEGRIIKSTHWRAGL